MKVLFACLADHAEASQSGKLNIMGVFDNIQARRFPAAHPQMFLVFRLLADFDDYSKPHRVTVKLIDQDGKVLAELQAQAGLSERVPPGQFVTLNQIIKLNNVIFPKAGRFDFVVTADGEETRVPFEVRSITRAQ